MKIVILGSCAFRNEKLACKKKLNEMGHEAIMHSDFDAFAKGEKQELWNQIQNNHAQAKKEQNYIKWYYKAIVNSDAALVINLDKNGKKSYIGGNVLMEMGFAHVHDKKIFLYNPLPEDPSFLDEIEAMYDEVINGDLKKIK